MTEELKSCAHCGSEVNLDFGMSGNPFISCEKCRLDMGGESQKEITDKWNRRASPWVRVEDGLPGAGDVVLIRVFYRKNELGFKEVVAFNGDNFICNGCIYQMKDITHWMPIPELPEIKE